MTHLQEPGELLLNSTLKITTRSASVEAKHELWLKTFAQFCAHMGDFMLNAARVPEGSMSEFVVLTIVTSAGGPVQSARPTPIR